MTEQEQPLEIREAAIQAELKKALEENPDALHAHLNNTWLNVAPAGEGEISFRAAPVLMELMDLKPAEHFSAATLTDLSELRKSQTNREFFQTLDAVREELDKTGEILEGIQEIKGFDSSGKTITRQDLIKAINKKLLPIYIRLRALGYEDADFNK